jgi:signal transduction histidine kinase
MAVVLEEDLASTPGRYGRGVRRGLGLRHPYLWGRDHPLVIDAAIAAAICGLGVITELATPAEPGMRDPNAFSLALTLAGTLPLALRRRFPVPVYAVCFATTLLHDAMHFPGGGPAVASLLALYTVAAHAGTRRAALNTLVVSYLAISSSLVTPPSRESVGEVVVVCVFVTVAWVLGDNMRIRRAYVTTVEERAARLEREQDAEAQRAVLQERTRIARELHDVVAHGMSVMVVQAGAARRTLARGDTERAAEALGTIETTGRSALDEMRRLVGVLRTPGGEGDLDGDRNGAGDDAAAARLPQPGIGDLDDLVRHCCEAGLDVTLRVQGQRRPLPSGLELVAYRIAQEALTNAIQHAGPASAFVYLEYGRESLRLTVTDDGRGASTSPRSEPGHGLAGMRERVQLYGGDISVGPRPGGGFRVSATLPVPGRAGARGEPSARPGAGRSRSQ